ncbi:phytoene desaturase family protein [Nocardioides sp. NPDC057767]|uniref:phytoene desaturase family protein n=1 Tax=unclassified Nocardioides TaxID=2615069 RepID=UPI00366CD6F0
MAMKPRSATVVGAGPNGLAAAIVLAQHGVRVTVLEAAETVGGGTRTAELTVPGLRHDICSAIHPLGVASPLLRELELDRYGLRWRYPEVELAHPLDGDEAALLHRSVEETGAGLGVDGQRWQQVFGPVVRGFDAITDHILGPILRPPRHPFRMAGFGLRAVPPATVLARAFREDRAKALFAGCAAHAFHPLDRPGTAAVGTMLIVSGHRHGWPVAEGGSQAITIAMAGLLEELGGSIVTGTTVRSLADLPDADATLFDTSPGGFADIVGEALPRRQRRAMRRWQHGPSAYKVDLAVRGPIPWRDPEIGRAGTVHLGGTIEEVAASEREIAVGRMPERPFVLLGQQYVADPSRSTADLNPVWAYAQVPHAYEGNATDVVLAQIERFAPGFRSQIVDTHVTTPADYAAYNLNYVGGDISTGANTLRQLVIRPTLAAYDTGIPGMFLCSSATPPAPGVHGMCGYHAARRALRHLGVAEKPGASGVRPG